MCEDCKPSGTLCPNCGADPCYHLCPNSVAYYSPEQERYDDMMDDGSDDHRERYAGETIGLSDADHEPAGSDLGYWTPVTGYVPYEINNDDLPF